MNGPGQPSPELSRRQSDDVLGHVAAAAGGQLPLAPALRTLADEIASRRVSRALVRLADELDRGTPLPEAARLAGLPPHLQGILLVGVESGSLAAALMQYAGHRRDLAALRHQMVLSTVYPAIVMAGTLLVTLAAAHFVSVSASDFIKDFGMMPPVQTRLLVALAQHTFYLVLGIVAVAAACLLLGPRRWRGAWKMIPLFGPVWRWTAQAEFCQLLSLLVQRGVPLPVALRLTAEGLVDQDLAKATVRVAAAVEQGTALDSAMWPEREFARTLVPWVGWSGHVGALADGLATAAEMFRARVRSQVGVLKIVLPPIMLVVVGWGVAFVAGALLFPMFSLFRALSY